MDAKDVNAKLRVVCNILENNHDVQKLNMKVVIEEYRRQPEQVLPNLRQLLSIYTPVLNAIYGGHRTFLFSYLKRLKIYEHAVYTKQYIYMY